MKCRNGSLGRFLDSSYWTGLCSLLHLVNSLQSIWVTSWGNGIQSWWISLIHIWPCRSAFVQPSVRIIQTHLSGRDWLEWKHVNSTSRENVIKVSMYTLRKRQQIEAFDNPRLLSSTWSWNLCHLLPRCFIGNHLPVAYCPVCSRIIWIVSCRQKWEVIEGLATKCPPPTPFSWNFLAFVQELYQLSKEKSDFLVVAAEEENSTAGSSGETEGQPKLSSPPKAAKQNSKKSPAKAKKPEGEQWRKCIKRSSGIHFYSPPPPVNFF